MGHASQSRKPKTQIFQDIFNSSPIGIAVESLEGQPLFVNPALCSMLGFSEEEMCSKHCVECSPPEDAKKDWALFEQLRAGSIDHYQIEKRFFRRDGSLMWGRSSISLLNRRPSPLVLVMVEDITEKKRAEEALRESEEQFRTLAEAIPQLCWMARGDGYVFWYNQRWYTYTGTTPEQMKGWGWQSVHDPRTLPSVLERWKAAISTGEPSGMIFPLRGADGVFRPFLTRVVPIKDADGRVVRWFGTDTDITELRDAQEALRASEERLRMGQWAAHIGTFDLNIRTGVNIWTPETEALFGLPPGGFGKTLTAFENLIHPDDRQSIIELTREAMRTGQPTEGEWRVVWPDGSLHWIASRGQVFMNESGEPSRMLGVNIDITKRKQAEEALSNMTRKLVEAQDQERARIARELHDDINQRLAMLAVELGQAEQNHPDLPPDILNCMHGLQQQTTQISADVQALSHDLHSSQLEYLGVVAGMKGWCKEFGARQGMQIDCRHAVRSTVPTEIGLCLFRVLQEALHNAAKHSGVKRIEVPLHEESDAFISSSVIQAKGSTSKRQGKAKV